MSGANKTYPLDTSGSKYQYLSASPLMQRDDQGHETGAQRLNREGLPMWKVRLLEMDRGSRDVIMQEVTVAAASLPAMTMLDEVTLVHPTIRAWAMQTGNGGVRSGVTLSAEGIRPVADSSTDADAMEEAIEL